MPTPLFVSPRLLVAAAAAAAITALFVAAPLQAAGGGGDAPAVRRELTADYARLTAAFAKRDPSVMDHLMTADYTAAGPKGKPATRAQVLADFKQQMAMLRDVQWQRTITKLNLAGGKAVATVEGHLTGTMTARDGADHHLAFDATTEDTWVRRGGGGGKWKLQHSRVEKTSMAFDGKPVVSRAGGGVY